MNTESWQQCWHCGETYHVLNGNYSPSRGISVCEYCTARLAEEVEPDKSKRRGEDYRERMDAAMSSPATGGQ